MSEQVKLDLEYDEYPLQEVRHHPDGSYTLKRNNLVLRIENPGFEPQVGQMARYYGKGVGYSVRGVVIAGLVVFYRPPTQSGAGCWPTQAGLYWYEPPDGSEKTIVQVARFAGELGAWVIGRDNFVNIGELPGRFTGPITLTGVVMTPEERYQRDPLFHQLVDLLEQQIREANLTPTEIREAAMLAAIHYEQKRMPTTLLGEAFIGERWRSGR